MAISIRQPWAWAVVYAGKDVENRSGRAILQMQSAIGQRIYVHASQPMQRSQFEAAAKFIRSLGIDCPPAQALDFGGVVGSVMVRDILYADDKGRRMLAFAKKPMKSRWFEGDYGFVLKDRRPVRFFEVKGRLGLFDVKPEQLDR
jgi:hypothetical protein